MTKATHHTSDHSKKKKTTPAVKQAIEKARAYCAYQERCQQEVREKLREFAIPHNEAEEIIAQLITENFINEERFARLYAGGKFRIKRWGRVKIRLELKKHDISDHCIKKGMEEIDERDYIKTLKKVIADKSLLLKEKDSFKRRHLLARFAISKGFEPDLVWGELTE